MRLHRASPVQRQMDRHFGALAVLLAVIGVYGVLSYPIERRTRALGIRLALGGDPPEFVRLVIGEGMSLSAVGIVIGIGGSLVLSRLLSSLLYGIGPRDPVTFVVIAALLSAAALLACYIPARRASKVDPVIALRCDG